MRQLQGKNQTTTWNTYYCVLLSTFTKINSNFYNLRGTLFFRPHSSRTNVHKSSKCRSQWLSAWHSCYWKRIERIFFSLPKDGVRKNIFSFFFYFSDHKLCSRLKTIIKWCNNCNNIPSFPSSSCHAAVGQLLLPLHSPSFSS